MWKCIRCEKENKDTAEICTECGHGRTMDYMRHRTLAKIPAKLAKNWKMIECSCKNARFVARFSLTCGTVLLIIALTEHPDRRPGGPGKFWEERGGAGSGDSIDREHLFCDEGMGRDGVP